MVLTQLIKFKRLWSGLSIVSIPLWFLRNRRYWNSYNNGDPMFPYHYGSYATEVDKNGGFGVLVFPYHYGSYATNLPEEMVPYVYRVSIPLWFLRNTIPRKFDPDAPILFPYHYGSYATNRRRGTVSCPQKVSIPLWFLRNQCRAPAPLTRTAHQLFPYHYGSYATRQKTVDR